MAPAPLLAALLLWAVPGAGKAAAPAAAEPGPVVIYLVRHAERADEPGEDPPLTQRGELRAGELARTLADVPLASINSTDYRRTLLTARQVAQQHGLEPELYDPSPRGLRDLAARLAAWPGHHLVVGHSNTTPELVRLLGGDSISAINETEYDRLYLVILSKGGVVASSLLRYGPRSAGNTEDDPDVTDPGKAGTASAPR
jgi:phosphohistidine phosphatase SixA